MASRRAARIAERIREEASNIILHELQDPRISFVTVTKVDLSRDYHHATVYVSVLGDEAKRRTALRGLASARGLVQSRIAKSLGLREAPHIAFEFDPTIERSIEISRLIDEAVAEGQPDAAQDQEPAEEAGEPTAEPQ